MTAFHAITSRLQVPITEQLATHSFLYLLGDTVSKW